VSAKAVTTRVQHPGHRRQRRPVLPALAPGPPQRVSVGANSPGAPCSLRSTRRPSSRALPIVAAIAADGCPNSCALSLAASRSSSSVSSVTALLRAICVCSSQILAFTLGFLRSWHALTSRAFRVVGLNPASRYAFAATPVLMTATAKRSWRMFVVVPCAASYTWRGML
jgi:hypothetical protein